MNYMLYVLYDSNFNNAVIFFLTKINKILNFVEKRNKISAQHSKTKTENQGWEIKVE